MPSKRCDYGRRRAPRVTDYRSAHHSSRAQVLVADVVLETPVQACSIRRRFEQNNTSAYSDSKTDSCLSTHFRVLAAQVLLLLPDVVGANLVDFVMV
jgi:hypothetical protein